MILANTAEEVAIADARMAVGDALSREVGVEVGSEPGGGSISCLKESNDHLREYDDDGGGDDKTSFLKRVDFER
ncbi:hypothetical protein EYC84_005555 [Monilinia fructicola]|uniref:Uncharacterized protein n=1 Tax=Monilinia fructicola TaxID=38448 RepID=A0A5M9K0Q2_MONFR|nr:hypothetical protein EYC84_005555 [Monilinia fructicola]